MSNNVHCIECQKKIENGEYYYLPGINFARCASCYDKVRSNFGDGLVPASTKFNSPFDESMSENLSLSDLLSEEDDDFLTEREQFTGDEAPLAIFTPNGLIEILNEEKVGQFWHGTDEVNEYITCDCEDMEPGVYRAVLDIKTWQCPVNGDWDSELQLGDLHQYDFKEHRWIPDTPKKTRLRMEGEGCENCGHGHEGVCSHCAGKYYGYQTEIGDGFWCENYFKRAGYEVTPQKKRFWFAWETHLTGHSKKKWPFNWVKTLPYEGITVYCAIVDCEGVEFIKTSLTEYYKGESNYLLRFVEERPLDWTPTARDESAVKSSSCEKSTLKSSKHESSAS